jgi:hypothetical protein
LAEISKMTSNYNRTITFNTFKLNKPGVYEIRFYILMYCPETICATSDDSIQFEVFLEDSEIFDFKIESYNYSNINTQLRWVQKKYSFEINYVTYIQVDV